MTYAPPAALNPDDELATVDRAGIAMRIRQMRHDRGWTQTELGAACDTCRFKISQWERSASGVRLVMLLRLADAFDITLDELVRGRR